MFTILISYFFILYIALGIGIIFNKWIRLEHYNIVFTILVGFFLEILFSTFYALFLPLDHYFFLINLIVSTLSIAFNFLTVKKVLINSINTFYKFSTYSKFLFLFIILTSLIHSSSLPFLTDNESYYIQTIKWLNNYGLVKGLANLHLFLGQHSGWHLLQSSFNFSFITSNLNDLNGFLIIATCFFCIEKWESYKLIGNKNDLFISLIIISLVFIFPFIASPSPDLPTLLIVTIIIHLFIATIKDSNCNHINLITILTLLVILIKVTVAPILILLFIILIRAKVLKNWRLPIVLSFISLLSFIIKNIIITGYPLYPLAIGNELINVDWKLNTNLQLAYYQWTSMYGWQMYNWEEFSNLRFINKFWIWINLPKLNGILNKLILLLMFIFPFFSYKKKELRYLYIFILIQFIVFYTTSPQYRFFLPFLLTMSLLIAVDLLHKKINFIKLLFTLNLVLLILLGIFGLNINGVTNNDIMSTKYALIPSQLISPRPITQFSDLKFSKYEKQNLMFYSPKKDSLFFWQTSNGPLPCANKDMIEYFSTYYNHIPQLRKKNIKDGFFSSKPEQ